MTLIAVMLSLAFAATPDPQIKPISARASSFAADYKGYTFGPAKLIDGSVETSWQPDPKASKDTLGVGQWFEIDLGATYDVTGWQLEMGLQKVDPKLGDLFCRNTRPSSYYLLFDDGSYSWELLADPNARRIASSADGINRSDKSVTSARTRFVRFTITQVHDAVDWKDPAIAELRVFGMPAPDLVAGTPTCPSASFTPLTKAVIEYCTGLGKALRNKAACDIVLDSMIRCRAQVSTNDLESKHVPLAPPDNAGIAAGKLTYRLTAFPNAPTEIDFAQTGTSWRVTRLTRKGEPWHEHLVERDGNFSNKCWEALKKTRPYEMELPDGSMIHDE